MRAFGLYKIVGFYLAMTSVSLGAIGARSGLRALLPGASWRAWLVAVALGLAAGMAVVVMTRISSHRFVWASRLDQEFRALVGDLSGVETFLIAASSGLGEETLFRGLLQPALGLWLGAAVFGLLHVGPNQRFVPWTVMAFLMGLLLGAMCLWTGNLLAAVLTHLTVNYMNLRYLAARPGVRL